MLSLLFDTQFWYDVLLVICIIGLIILCVKVKGARVFVFSLLGIGLIGITGYCGVELNNYYNAEGGIYGYISGLILPDQKVENDDKFSLTLNNLVLQQELNDRYSTMIYLDDSIKLDETANYGLFVNEIYCPATISSDFVLGSYSYIFMDAELDELLSDTLHFQFAFYDKGAELKLYTDGGQTAVDYWNKYFSRNTMVVSVEQTDIVSDSSIEEGSGDVSDFRIVNYYYEDELVLKQVYKVGSTITPPIRVPGIDVGTSVETWLTVDGSVFDFSTKITEDLNLYVGEIEESLNIIKFISSSDGSIDNQNLGIKFNVISKDIGFVTGEYTSEMTIQAKRYNSIVVEANIRYMFDFTDFVNSLYVYGDDGYIKDQIKLISAGSRYPMDSGFNYFVQFEIPNINHDATIVLKSEQKVYDLALGYYDSTNTYRTIVLEDAYYYGCTLDLNTLLNTSQKEALTSARSSGAKFNGLSTGQIDGQGVKFFDRNLNSLRPLTLDALSFNGIDYDFGDNFNPNTQTFTIYAVYNVNI